MTEAPIATTYQRHDDLEPALRTDLSGCDVIRLRGPEELTREALSAMSPHFAFLPHRTAMNLACAYDSFPCEAFHMKGVRVLFRI